MPTVYDIAKAAGVSYSTATRVLNGQVSYTRPTYARRAAKIRKIASEMGYRPNVAAQATSSGRFNAVGVVLRRDKKLGFGPHPSYLRGICKALDESGQTMVFAPVSPDELDSPDAARILHQKVVDGLILTDRALLGGPAEAALDQLHLPAVWMNVKRPYNAVYPDDEHGGRVCTEHLLQRGHRRIAFVGPPDTEHYSSTERVAGYAAAMKAAGLSPTPVIWHHQPGQRVAQLRELFQSPDRPTAVVAMDQLYEPVLLAAAHQGLRTARDLSIINLANGQPLAAVPVDTYEIPAYWVGYHAVRMLNRRVGHPDVDQPAHPVTYDKHIPGKTVAGPAS
jgi:LacI family transcriptional regulator